MGTDFEVTMNEYLPLRDVVFNTLRQAILRGELKPGERFIQHNQFRMTGKRSCNFQLCCHTGGERLHFHTDP